MNISLHKCARTTPAIRAEIAASSEPASVLAERYNLSLCAGLRARARAGHASRTPRGE